MRQNHKRAIGWDVHQDHINGVAKEITDLGYSGPLAVATDCTTLLPALRFDARNSSVVGVASGAIEVATAQDIHGACAKGRGSTTLATKVRVYTLQIPSPKIMPYIVVVMPATGSETGKYLAQLHKRILDACYHVGMQVISFSADGASEEQSALLEIKADAPYFKSEYVQVHNTVYGIDWKALVQQNGCPLVLMGEAKHNKKNAPNALQSGARALDMHKGVASYAQLVALVQSRIAHSKTVLRLKDVHRVGKQED